ncbi:MAG TPA: aminotransferase class IV, partial [Myxococcota bacterium]|nr:aminotransferase class IV [Myxococcota bacterium]
MGVEKTERVWHNGALIPWDDANVHILTHTLHYGLGVFEGIRCYRSDDGAGNVFRLKEHVARLFDSARIVEIAMSYDHDAIETAILDTLRANRMSEGYIRPLVYLGAGAMGLLPKDNPTQVAIIVWPWGAYLGEE